MKTYISRNSIPLLIIGAALILSNVAPAKADIISVAYTTTNTTGTTWMYNYSLSGTYSAGDDVAIYFPYATSSTLTDLGTGSASLKTFALQPDLVLPANGEFDILSKSYHFYTLWRDKTADYGGDFQ